MNRNDNNYRLLLFSILTGFSVFTGKQLDGIWYGSVFIVDPTDIGFLFFEGISTGIKIKHIYVTLVYTVQSSFFIENVPKSEINIYCLQMKSTEWFLFFRHTAIVAYGDEFFFGGEGISSCSPVSLTSSCLTNLFRHRLLLLLLLL